jgi:hypothetical protein
MTRIDSISDVDTRQQINAVDLQKTATLVPTTTPAADPFAAIALGFPTAGLLHLAQSNLTDTIDARQLADAFEWALSTKNLGKPVSLPARGPPRPQHRAEPARAP